MRDLSRATRNALLLVGAAVVLLIVGLIWDTKSVRWLWSTSEIDVADRVDRIVNWMDDEWARFFDNIKTGGEHLIGWMEDAMAWPEPVVFALIAGLLVIVLRSVEFRSSFQPKSFLVALPVGLVVGFAVWGLEALDVWETPLPFAVVAGVLAVIVTVLGFMSPHIGVRGVVRGLPLALFTFVSFRFVDSMELWGLFTDTLALILVATGIAILVSIPIGLAAARSRTISVLVRPVLDFMQTLPVFVYLLPALAFFSVGVVGGLFATLLFAIPPGVRLTELGIRQVDKEVVEAAESFGASRRQLLWGVKVPLAMPSIMQGINQVIMLGLSMVVIAALGGAGGLGNPVVAGVSQLAYGTGFEGGFAVVIMAIFLDRLTSILRDRSVVQQ